MRSPGLPTLVHPLKTFRVPLALTAIAVVLAAVIGGPDVALIVALLAVLEISISFDNAIVNAAVLRTMAERWQRIFLTWGILIAVFGMRLVFPIVIVAVAAGISLPTVIDLAVNHPEEYATKLDASYPVIAAFGGTFLLLVFLEFFLDAAKDVHWLGPIERPLGRLGVLQGIAPAFAAIGLLIVSQVVAEDEQASVLVAGLAGMVANLLSNGASGVMEDRLERDQDERAREEAEEAAEAGDDPGAAGALVRSAAKGGLASFLYLELLDASFSFDGVIGAFAISTDVLVIAIGLGLGALYIRTMTVFLVREGTLSHYRYLEHGAHWAIGILAVLLFVGIEHHLPEAVTGLLGATCILAAFLSSIAANRRDATADRHGVVSTTSA